MDQSVCVSSQSGLSSSPWALTLTCWWIMTDDLYKLTALLAFLGKSQLSALLLSPAPLRPTDDYTHQQSTATACLILNNFQHFRGVRLLRKKAKQVTAGLEPTYGLKLIRASFLQKVSTQMKIIYLWHELFLNWHYCPQDNGLNWIKDKLNNFSSCPRFSSHKPVF